MSEPPSASPTCFAHEADDGYMGFAKREEIVAFLEALDEAPAATKVNLLRGMLPKIRDDVLHAELEARLAAIESAESRT